MISKVIWNVWYVFDMQITVSVKWWMMVSLKMNNKNNICFASHPSLIWLGTRITKIRLKPRIFMIFHFSIKTGVKIKKHIKIHKNYNFQNASFLPKFYVLYGVRKTEIFNTICQNKKIHIKPFVRLKPTQSSKTVHHSFIHSRNFFIKKSI